MLVNEQGVFVSETETQTQGGESTPIGSTEQPIVVNNENADIAPLNAEHAAVLNYNKKIRKVVSVPKPTEEDFCRRVKEFIETRGDGMATSDQLLEAYDLFQKGCIEKKEGGEGEAEKGSDAGEEQMDGGAVTSGKITRVVTEQPVVANDGDSAEPLSPAEPIVLEYLNRDRKVTTFDDDLGVRPNYVKRIQKVTETEEERNKNPYLFFLVILGVATLVYAINKKN